MKSIRMLLLAACFLMISCKINQHKNGLRSGKWVFRDSTFADIFVSEGRFRKGIEVGRWKHYDGGRLVKTERFKGNKAKVVNYYSDKRIHSKGFTIQEKNANILHWYYTGQWVFYTPSGSPDTLRTYEKGTLIAEEIKK